MSHPADDHVPASRKALERLVLQNLQTSHVVDGEARRGQHGKHHALARGSFRILSDIPKEMAVGTFQPGANFECEVRFSNGGQTDDRKADVRGIAIKLHGVTGDKLFPGRGDACEHDFLLVDHPTYFSRSIADYLAFNRFILPIQAISKHPFSLMRAAKALVGLVMLVLLKLPELRRARQFAGRKPNSLLGLTYHSTTPYALGERYVVKYKLITRAKREWQQVCSPDGLGARLCEDLQAGETAMEFWLVIQNNPVSQPIEDATLDWERAGARSIKVAVITLLKQEQNAQTAKRAAKAVFSPWMAGNPHRPLGEINRARLWVYSAMARARQDFGKRP